MTNYTPGLPVTVSTPAASLQLLPLPTPATGYAVDGDELSLDAPVTFTTAIADAKSTLAGHTLVNGTKFETIDADTSLADARRYTIVDESLTWYPPTHTAPLDIFHVDHFDERDYRRYLVHVRASGLVANYDQFKLIVLDEVSNAEVISLGCYFSTTLKIWGQAGATNVTADITAGELAAGIWLCIEVQYQAGSWSWMLTYSKVATVPTPSEMVFMLRSSAVATFTAMSRNLRVGILLATQHAGANTIVADCDYFKVDGEKSTNPWNAQQFPATSPIQSCGSVDLLGRTPILADLRAACLAAEDTSLGATVEWALVQSATPPDAADTWSAAGALDVTAGGSGTVYSLAHRIVSDGNTTASVRYPIAVASS